MFNFGKKKQSKQEQYVGLYRLRYEIYKGEHYYINLEKMSGVYFNYIWLNETCTSVGLVSQGYPSERKIN